MRFQLLFSTLLACILYSPSNLSKPLDPLPTDKFIGKQQCVNCHQKTENEWQGSHHDLAMQIANVQSVLGDFNNVTFNYYSTSATFYTKHDKYYVKTQNEKGSLTEYEITHTFGVYPLQQYLVKFPDGKLQALSIAWDTRPLNQGGQRWYHVQAELGDIKPNDPLHWTGNFFNWNSRCAECHSTGYQKNFDVVDLRYESSWTDIDVACESCHGPGKDHVDWVNSGADGNLDNGLLNLAATGSWQYTQNQDTAVNVNRTESLQIDTCAHCHSRRVQLTENYLGKSFNEAHQLQLLDENIYHPDGQIQEENFVYGSFIQSKMYHAGVSCIDCHKPHNLNLKLEGNKLCAQCHKPSVFDTPKHHNHQQGPGTQCVNCHMPETTYMGVDPRRDHSFKIPRPDLSQRYQTPNACMKCHQDKDNKWASHQLSKWYPEGRADQPYESDAIFAGRKGKANATKLLTQLAMSSQADIFRATALYLLNQTPTQEGIEASIQAMDDDNAMVQTAAMQSMAHLPIEQAYQYLAPKLDSEQKSVRIEAARLLATVPLYQLPREQAEKLKNAQNEYIETLNVNSDTSTSHHNKGLFYAQQSDLDLAANAYRKALEINPQNIPALVNLADIYRQRNQDAKAISLLQEAIGIMPNNAMAQFSLGLGLVRQKKISKALVHLRLATELAPTEVYYLYVYAVALDSNNETKDATRILEKAVTLEPNNQQVISALLSYYQKLGEWNKAKRYMDVPNGF